MTEQPNRFRGLVPDKPVQIPPLTNAQRFARSQYADLTHGPVPDTFAREQQPRNTKPKRETKSQKKDREEHDKMKAAGFIKRGDMWYLPPKHS